MTRIILLNGASSSGKSSVAKLLHKKLLSPPWMYFQLDNFLHQLPLDHIKDPEEFAAVLPKAIFGFHSSVALMADSGVNCIVDHVFQEKGWYEDFSTKCQKHQVTLVGLHCPKEVLAVREKERGDRQVGLAVSQVDKVHRGINYSLDLDTSRLSAEECCEVISKYKPS